MICRLLLKKIAFVCGALMGISLAIPAAAHKPLKASEAVLDPTKGYILVRVGPAGSMGPGAAVVFARLDPYSGKIIGDGKLNALSKKEYDAAVAMGGNVLAMEKDTKIYLIPVNPGKWIIAGTGASIFSLGTFGFEVKAGEVADIGTILIGREDGKSTVPEIAAARLSQDLVDFGTMMNIVMTDAMLLKPASEGLSVPQQLGAWTVRPATIQPDVRFDNVYQGLINRALGLPPMGHEPVRSAAPIISAPTSSVAH